MRSPKTPQQLAQAIEALVGSYVDEARRIAQVALNEAFARTSGRGRKLSKAPRGVRTREEAGSGKRRSTGQIAEVQEQLYHAVCAGPGESMAVFAEVTGLPVRALQRPMSRLRADGRVRCVGERTMARYFPALGRRPRNADA
jgi:hypothetical protein